MHTIKALDSRSARARRGVAVALTALAGSTLIGACGSSSPSASSTPTAILKSRTIARAIEHSIFTQRHIHTTVSCPAAVPQQKGRNFVCIARTRGSTSKTPVAVTQQNNKGYVKYRVE